jgi:GNAT superfamily N-acetyltransferase
VRTVMKNLSGKLFAASSVCPRLFAGIARNRRCGKKAPPFTAARTGGYLVEPLSKKYLAAAADLYASLNDGARLGMQKRAVLWLLGSQLCLVARDMETNELMGMVIYYFNARDEREGTVHEGYIGVRERARNAGLGTFMRRHALEHFARTGLSGVSSRISVGNLPSLKSNEKLGFVAVETYFDPSMGDRRHYLVCDLSRYQKPLFEREGSCRR